MKYPEVKFVQAVKIGQSAATLPDDAIVDRVRGGDTALFEILIRRHNERVFRTARAVTGNDDDAEDVMQETYVRAYRGLSGFEGRARFSTWLTRIAVNEALARRRARRRQVTFGDLSMDQEVELLSRKVPGSSPEDRAAREEMVRLLGRAIDGLPEELRLVVSLRDIQGLSTRETADITGHSEANVKVRLHRARRELRRVMERRLGSEIRAVYSFHLSRCDRIVRRVFERIAPPE